MRDDFTNSTKDTMAKRVGYKCSNPNCRKPTIGPRSEDDKTVNIGIAAHITAASEGGPRYDSTISSTERKDISNGIWLCQNCAKLIDNDATKYSVDLLKKWKEISELSASLDIETGDSTANKKINVVNSPGSINTVNQSGDNTIINKKVEIPKPTVSLKSLGYIDNLVSEDLSNENKKLPKGEKTLYKSYLEFEFKSEIQRSNIDFLVHASTIYHVKMRYGQGMFETSNWETNDKIKGKRFFSPQNGTYEMTIYTEKRLVDIWQFLRINMNDIEAEINK